MRYASLVLFLIVSITCTRASLSRECPVTCGSVFNPVCASDGKTYNNRCLLLLRNCQRYPTEEEVNEVHAGECEEEKYDWDNEMERKYECLRIGRGKYLMC